VTPVRILVYHVTEAGRYADLIRAPRGRVAIALASTPEDAGHVVSGADIVYGWNVPPAILALATRARWLQAMSAGVEWALVPELPAQIAVTRVPGVFGAWMAEYVLGWALSVTQRTETYRTAQRERRWVDEVVPERLRDKTFAIVGLGDIGRVIARHARVLGARVVGVSRSGARVPGVDRVFRLAGLARALREADFVVLTLPLTPATAGLIDREALAAMQPAAWLINVGRGRLVDETALVDALARHRIGGAILDVFAEEPLPRNHPLWSTPNTVVTPHIAGPSTPDEIAPVFNDNLARFLAGRPLRHVVNRVRGY
jgi:glyoxylate/hydroxypyruvate reductase A